MSRRRLFVFVLCVLLLAFSAILALLIVRGGNGPEADYTELFEQGKTDEAGIFGFVKLEPRGVHHTADPIRVRVGVVYDRDKWEMPEETFRRAIPLPEEFKIRERKTLTVQQGRFSLIETRLMAQCFECRDGKYEVSFRLNDEPRARNKGTGETRGGFFSNSSSRDTAMVFAPLTDRNYRVDDTSFVDLALHGKESKARQFSLFAMAFLCALGAVTLFLYSCRLKRGKVSYDTNVIDRRSVYLRGLFDLGQELTEENREDVSHALYLLLDLAVQEFQESVALADVRQALEAAYSRESLKKDDIERLISRARACILRGGEE